MNDGSAAAGPRIERVNAKIGTLERRIEWLRSRLSSGSEQRNERQAAFDRAEVEALEAACSVLRYHRQALNVETDPVLALAELHDCVADDYDGLPRDAWDNDRLVEAMTRAERVLKELSPDS